MGRRECPPYVYKTLICIFISVATIVFNIVTTSLLMPLSGIDDGLITSVAFLVNYTVDDRSFCVADSSLLPACLASSSAILDL